MINQPSKKLIVGLCTYKRLSSLLRLLEHIAYAAKSLDKLPSIVVVDNDGNDSAVGLAVNHFAKQSGFEITYLIERKPGISAARNKIFEVAFQQNARFVAMIDDDEWPSEAWLTEMLAAQENTNAVVVGGPVSPVFPDHAAHLQKYARYWSVEKQFLNGKPFVFCTCNFLIDLEAVAEMPRPLFDEAFGLSGGGDTVFFRKLFFAGHQMAWSDSALVYEEVPDARANFSWMRQRRFRVGNHAVRWESLDAGKFKSCIKTVGLMMRLCIYPLFRREPESPFVGWLLEYDKVRGRIAGHFGDVFVEYARPASICKKDD
jgi:succinoglycan biosynthesis protein ExoM